jgi:hypothetical protein
MATAIATALHVVMDSAAGGFLPRSDDYAQSLGHHEEYGQYLNDLDGVAIRSDESSSSDESDSRENYEGAAAPDIKSASLEPASTNSDMNDTQPPPADKRCDESMVDLESTGAEDSESEVDSDPRQPPPPIAFIETTTEQRSLPLSPRIKPALKRVSSNGRLMEEEEIPISLKRSAWKTLPVPTVTPTRRISSTGSFHPPNTTSKNQHRSRSVTGTEEVLDTMELSPKSIKRNVSFAKIHVRDYELTVGDNPAVGYGAPVSLDWTYVEHDPLELDQYEDNRPKRRNPQQMHLNSVQREHILQLHNFSSDDIKKAKRDAERIQRQRFITAYFAPYMKIEDVLESAARKTKRFIRKARSGSAPTSALQAAATSTTTSSLFPRPKDNVHRSRSMGALDEEDTIDGALADVSVSRSIVTI